MTAVEDVKCLRCPSASKTCENMDWVKVLVIVISWIVIHEVDILRTLCWSIHGILQESECSLDCCQICASGLLTAPPPLPPSVCVHACVFLCVCVRVCVCVFFFLATKQNDCHSTPFVLTRCGAVWLLYLPKTQDDINLYSPIVLPTRTAFKYLRAAWGTTVPFTRTATASAI